MCECTSAHCNSALQLTLTSFLVTVTVFSHSRQDIWVGCDHSTALWQELLSCAHGNIHSFSVFSRVAIWPSSSGNLHLSFLRDLMHYKLQINFSYQGTISAPPCSLAIHCHFSRCFGKSRIMRILWFCLVIFVIKAPPPLPSHLHLRECHLHKLVARKQLSWEMQCVKWQRTALPARGITLLMSAQKHAEGEMKRLPALTM